jgi:hypothetical protein
MFGTILVIYKTYLTDIEKYPIVILGFSEANTNIKSKRLLSDPDDLHLNLRKKEMRE